MLYRVMGPAGSGKTEYLYGVLAEAFIHGESCVWITPEQQSFQTEREILARIGNLDGERVGGMTFAEMPDRVARLYGGSSVAYLEKGAVFALLSVLVARNRSALSEYAASAEDPGFLSGLLHLFKRLRSAMITPDMLAKAAESGDWTDFSRLRGKLRDAAVLYKAYDDFFTDERQDAHNRLTILADRLSGCPYFAGKIVILDGFYRLHEQELAVLRQILKQAKAVWCGFTADEREQFSAVRTSANRLGLLADSCRDIWLKGYRRGKEPAFRFLEAYLWSDETPVFDQPVPCIRLTRAGHAFDEAHAVASQIMELVRSGMRFRDITVFARNPQNYAGILDAVFRSAGIPYFYSEKEDITARPLVAFVFASLEMIATKFSLSSVRKYLKTGYSGMTADESDALLRYAESWSLHGNVWLSQKPWTRNPGGYRAGPMTEEQKATLETVNRARELFAVHVYPLSEAFKKKEDGTDPTVGEMLEALYRHLERCGAADRFVYRVNGMLANGEQENARRESQIWEVLVSIFERLHEICGQEVLTPARLLVLLRMTAEQFDVGTIPSSADCVSIGDPTAMCPDSAKAVFLIGCNEGVFPAAGGPDTLFDDMETGRLQELNLPVADGLDDRLTEERFYFYTAVLSASERLYLSYSSGTVNGEPLRPSFALTRICTLFPQLKEETFRADPENLLYSAESASRIFPLLREGKAKEEIRRFLLNEGYSLRDVPTALFDPNASAPSSSDTVTLSPSSLETYRKCPFRYFGQYVLKLEETKKNGLGGPEFGTLVHGALESFVRNHTKDGRFVPPAGRAELEREADALLAEQLEKTGLTNESGGRFRHTCRNVREVILFAAEKLTEEMQSSRFVPAGFEVGIGRKGGNSLPALAIRTKDGKTVYLVGSIDRVDCYRKDDVTYVRVVDYKTYGKELSMRLVNEFGLDQQMFLYLLAYCKNGGRGLRDGEVLEPAGVLYNNAELSYLSVQGTETPDQLEQRKENELRLKHTGVLLNDKAVLAAMDGSGDGQYLPSGLIGAKGLKEDSSNLLTGDQFRSLFDGLERRLAEDGDRILNGRMDIRPVKADGLADGCAYCPMKAACRYTAQTRSDGEAEGGED